MSIIQKAIDREGLHLVGDKLNKNERTQKVFQRLIAAMRAMEADVQDMLTRSERELAESLRDNGKLRDRLHQADGELLQLRLKDRMSNIESLTQADKTKLLECSGITNGE